MAAAPDSDDYDKLCARVRQVAEDKGLSWRGWSLKAGLGHSYISQLLDGRMRKQGPGTGAIEALARAAGVDAVWLQKGRGTREAGPEGEPRPPEAQPYRAQALALLKGHVHANALAALEAERPADAWPLERWLKRGHELHGLAVEIEAKYRH